MTEESKPLASNFIRDIMDEDIKSGKHDKIITRFPPEPNGYLHIGHAKAICINYGLAEEFKGTYHLRFDDTNPEKEDIEYIESIKNDIKWLGFDWEDKLFHASDYFDQLYDFAVELIKMGKAYVCHLTPEEMREYRGTLTEPGKNSPHRERSEEENLDLFTRMKKGEFADGECVLRAKIDMSSPNINMRDPIIYRIKKIPHPMTGDKWCIYPMYDFTHCLSDAIEFITHSLCSLEFEDHRPLYDWFIDELKTPGRPRQIEFSRLNLNYTIMSKRYLRELVEKNHVDGWDDPRMPTLSGMRRRGYTPTSIRNFMARLGASKRDSVIDMSILEDCVREDLNEVAPRTMAVLKPIKVVIENFPEGEVQEIKVPIHPQKPEMGERTIHFSRNIFIEASDFMMEPPKKFFRLGPDRNVRLRYAYVIHCHEVIHDEVNGGIAELRCTYNPDTFAGKTPEGMKKVKGIIHWICQEHSAIAEVRQYDRLFNDDNPGGYKDRDYKEFLNKDSLDVLEGARVPQELGTAPREAHFQFERMGYFTIDNKLSHNDAVVINRTVTLRDAWAKVSSK